jgi:hypothetical protein
VRHCRYGHSFTSALDHNDRQEQIMIEYDLDTEHSTLLVHPKSALDRSDFSELARAVDPQIEAAGVGESRAVRTDGVQLTRR